jgi:hypothetical protein
VTTPAPDRRCGTCVFWERSKANQELGYCEWPRLHQPASLYTRPVMHMNDGTDCAKHDGGSPDAE